MYTVWHVDKYKITFKLVINHWRTFAARYNWCQGPIPGRGPAVEKYCSTPILTPHSTVLLEKLTGSQLVKKFPAFYGTRRFITPFAPPVPILSQIHTVHTLTSHVLKIHLNINLPSTPGSPQWSLSPRFPHQDPVYASPIPHRYYMPRPSHSCPYYHPNNIWYYRLLSSSLCSFLHSPVTSSLLGKNILHSTLFSNTLSLSSSLSERPSFTPIQNRQNYSSV